MLRVMPYVKLVYRRNVAGLAQVVISAEAFGQMTLGDAENGMAVA